MNFRRILDYIYPPRCPICDEISTEGICGQCRRKVVYIRDDYCLKCGRPLTDSQKEYCYECMRRTHFFFQGRSLFSYQGEVKASLYRFKYGNRREYAESYGEEIAGNLGRWILRNHITKIVPIPLHASRRRKRGYNQAALLAREVGGRLHIQVDEKMLYRVKKTEPQKKLSAQERRENLTNAFEVRKKPVRGEHILLIDDIYTTGNTVDIAAKCLRDVEKCRIYVLTVAIGG